MSELISIPLKKPAEVDFLKPLQNVIRMTYSTGNKQPKDYTEAIKDLNQLRNNALWRAFEKYESSLELMYRYYDQLSALEAKIQTHELNIPFKWKDAFDKTLFGGKLSLTINTIPYEKCCVLFNIGALQSAVAAGQSLDTDEGLKLAAKLFQSAAGIFDYLKSSTLLAICQEPTPDMSPETLDALKALMMAQAQETFVLKAIHDNMKDISVAKLAAQTEDMYADALKLFQKEIFRAFWDKDWVPIIAAKQAGYKAMSEFYHSLVLKEQKNHGSEIARLDHAVELFKTAQSRFNRINLFQDYSTRAARNLAEARKDNDFIYHAKIPDRASLEPIPKACLAKVTMVPTKFSSEFKDLFADLMPAAIHHALTNYEAHKVQLVNTEIAKLRDLKQVMNGILASLNLPAAIEDLSGIKVPQSLLEKSASVRQSGGIQALQKMMSELPHLLQTNKDILNEMDRMLDEEQRSDDEMKEKFKKKWNRLPSVRLTEQFRSNNQKYRGIIENAISADKIIQQKFETHYEYVNILSMSEAELARAIPQGSAVKESPGVVDLRKLMEDVDTLRAEQEVIESELTSATTDIKATFLNALVKDGVINETKLIQEGISSCYTPLQKQVQECEERQKQLIAQIQAKHEQFTREQASTGNAREEMLRKLAAAYDAFKELLRNLNEGIKFYNELTQLLAGLQQKISDFCFARKTEKEELLKNITTTLSEDKPSPPLNLPSHHSNMMPTSPPQQTLPYPTQDQQRSMPLPFGGVIPTAYPYVHQPPPMPAMYNPYATMPQAGMYGGYPQQPPQMPPSYNPYATMPPRNYQQ